MKANLESTQLCIRDFLTIRQVALIMFNRDKARHKDGHWVIPFLTYVFLEKIRREDEKKPTT